MNYNYEDVGRKNPQEFTTRLKEEMEAAQEKYREVEDDLPDIKLKPQVKSPLRNSLKAKRIGQLNNSIAFYQQELEGARKNLVTGENFVPSRYARHERECIRLHEKVQELTAERDALQRATIAPFSHTCKYVYRVSYRQTEDPTENFVYGKHERAVFCFETDNPDAAEECIRAAVARLWWKEDPEDTPVALVIDRLETDSFYVQRNQQATLMALHDPDKLNEVNAETTEA